MKVQKNNDALLQFLERQKENNKFWRSIEIGTTFILISFFAYFALKPTFFIISSLIGDIKSKTLMSKELSKKIANILEAQDNFSKIQKDYKLIDSCLPDFPRYAHAIDQITYTGSNSNISFSKISFDLKEEEENKKNNLKSFSLVSSTKSEFYPAINFLNKLAANRRIIDINSIGFSNSKKQSIATNSAENQISFSLNTKIYYWKSSNETN